MSKIARILMVVALAGCPQPKSNESAEANVNAEAPAGADAADHTNHDQHAAHEAAATADAAAIPERGDDADRKSKNGHLQHTLFETAIDVRFGRPQVRGRDVFTDLAPAGKVWRTGADEATTFAIDKPLKVEGETLAAGVYSLFTIPGESEWTVIFNRTAKQWGSFRYDEGQDALRVQVTPATAEHEEAFDIQARDNGIALRWGTLEVPITLAAADG